jgi:hypothetical protein
VNVKRKPSGNARKLRTRLVVKRKLERRRPKKRSVKKRKKRRPRKRQKRNGSPKKRLKRTDLPKKRLRRTDWPSCERKRRRQRRTRLPGRSVLLQNKLGRLLPLLSESEKPRNSLLLPNELPNKRRLLPPLSPSTLKKRLELLTLFPPDLALRLMLPLLYR